MNKQELIKYSLIALGVYLVYRYIEDHGGLEKMLAGVGTPAAPGPAAPGTHPDWPGTPAPGALAPGAVKVPPAPAPPAAAASPAPAAQTVLQRVAAAAGVSALNFDQWCYYFAQVTGTPCPDPAAIYSGDRSAAIDINTWWAAMHAAGMGDLGLIMPAFSQNMTGWYM